MVPSLRGQSAVAGALVSGIKQYSVLDMSTAKLTYRLLGSLASQAAAISRTGDLKHGTTTQTSRRPAPATEEAQGPTVWFRLAQATHFETKCAGQARTSSSLRSPGE